MTRRLQRFIAVLRQDEGSNLVETALSATVMFAMLFGIAQMSIAMYAYHYTSDAARQATRYAMVRGSTSCTNTPNLSNCNASVDNITTYVKSLNYPGINTSNLTVTTTWCAASTTHPTASNPTTWPICSATTSKAPGNLVKITVKYPLAFTIPFSSSPSLNLSATSQMLISQ